MNSAQRAFAVRNYQLSTAAVAIDASPHRQIALLFEGAIERLNNAIAAVKQRNVAGKLRNADGVIEIVKYLKGVLDFKAGGSIAVRLAALYDYVLRRLVSAKLEGDARGFEEVAALLRTVKSGWDGIAPR